MESGRKENFSEASAVHKGEFRNFFNVGVAEVNPLKQSATVTRMRSNSCKILRESKCGDSRRAKTASRPAVLTLGGMDSPKANSARLMHP